VATGRQRLGGQLKPNPSLTLFGGYSISRMLCSTAAAAAEPVVVVLDEFPCLLASTPGLPSVIQSHSARGAGLAAAAAPGLCCAGPSQPAR